jgi:hypothetical protein
VEVPIQFSLRTLPYLAVMPNWLIGGSDKSGNTITDTITSSWCAESDIVL